MMKIKEKNQPLSTLVEKKIIEYINTNDIQIDEKIPTEPKLMELLGVSRYTIREALALLSEKNIIYKTQGKGTFLKKKPIEISSGLEKLESINQSIERYGLTPGTKWVDIEENQPTEMMIEKLKISKSDKVITFKRIKMADDKVAAYCVDTIPKFRMKSEISKNLGDKSLFKYLEEHDIEITSSVSDILPSFPTDEMKKLLNVKEDHLFLLLYQIHYDRNGKPTLYSLDYFDPKVFKFQINRIR